MKVSVYIATSLDGFIARADGGIDWLVDAGDPNDPEDYGYAAFMAGVDCLVMGRNTFEMAMSFPEWPHEGKRVIVLSRALRKVPQQAKGKIEIFASGIEKLMAKLESEGVRRIYVDGGKTIQSFLKAGLVDDLTLTRIPVLIGSGVPLFGSLEDDVRLVHVSTTVFKSGFVQSIYKPQDSAPATPA